MGACGTSTLISAGGTTVDFGMEFRLVELASFLAFSTKLIFSALFLEGCKGEMVVDICCPGSDNADMGPMTVC